MYNVNRVNFLIIPSVIIIVQLSRYRERSAAVRDLVYEINMPLSLNVKSNYKNKNSTNKINKTNKQYSRLNIPTNNPNLIHPPSPNNSNSPNNNSCLQHTEKRNHSSFSEPNYPNINKRYKTDINKIIYIKIDFKCYHKSNKLKPTQLHQTQMQF